MSNTRLIIFGLCLLISRTLFAGGVVNNGAHINITGNTTLKIVGGSDGSFSNKSSGKIKLNGKILVSGDWTNASGSGEIIDDTSSGTVVFNGGDQAVSGLNSFYDLTKETSTLATLTFANGSDNKITIKGTLKLSGSSNNLLSLRSDSSGKQWFIDPQSTRNLSFLDIKDSKNVNEIPIDVISANCVDSGNNSFWKFYNSYTVKFIAGENGTLLGETEQLVEAGKDCTAVTAIPDENYQFDSWSGDYTGTDNPLTITNVTSDMTITANFIKGITPVTLTMAASPADNGSTTPTEGKHIVNAKIPVDISATPADGFIFVYWDGTKHASIADSNSSSTTVTLTNDATVTAHFAVEGTSVTMKMTANPSRAGKTVPSKGSYSVEIGESQTIEAIPAEGYLFSSWTVTAKANITDPESSITTVRLNGNATITANFVKAELLSNSSLAVRVSPLNGGTVTPENPLVKLQDGDPVDISVVPNTGYTFDRWLIKGNSSCDDITSPSTTVIVNGDTIVTANMVIENMTAGFEINASPEEGGTVSPADKQTVNIGSIREITAIENTGYKFIFWELTGNSEIMDKYSSSTDIIIKGETNLTAIFAKEEDTSLLTIETASSGGGTVENSGKSNTYNGEVRRLVARVYANNVFVRWEISGNATIDNLYASDTNLRVQGSSSSTKTASGDEITVKAVFAAANSSTNLKYPKIRMLINDHTTNRDRISIIKMPMSQTSFAPVSDTITITIDGVEINLDSENGKFSTYRHGYRYRATDRKSHFTLNLTDKWWKLVSRSLDLSQVNNIDGVDIVMSIGDSSSGANYMMDELTRYRFTEKNDSPKIVMVPGKQLESMNVEKLSMKFLNTSRTRNKLNIPKAELSLSNDSFNPDTDFVAVDLNELSIVVSAGSFGTKGQNNYIFKSKDEGIWMKLDFANKKWALKLNNPDIWGKINPNEAINLYLTIGDASSAESFQGNRKTWLTYRRRRYHSGRNSSEKK